MKTLFKKSLMSAALILMSANTMAAAGDSATGVFQWSGVAPTENVNDGLCIKPASGVNGVVDHSAGAITFHNPSADNTTHDIQSSTELAFTVMNGNDCTLENGAGVPFSYTLTNLKVGINGGQLETQDLAGTGWRIKHSKPGVPADDLNEVAADPIAEGGDVIALTIAGTGLEVAPGESVIVQAFVLVNDATPI